MLGGVPHQGGLLSQPVWVTCFGEVSYLTRLTRVIKSLKIGELFRRFHLQNHQIADEIDSAGDNLSLESDSRANQRNHIKVLPATTTLKRKAASLEQTIVPSYCSLDLTPRRRQVFLYHG